MCLEMVSADCGEITWVIVPLAVGYSSLLGKCLEPECSAVCVVVAVATLDADPTVLPLVVLCLWGILPQSSHNCLSELNLALLALLS